MSETPREAPPAGEEIHLPGPTLIPITTAVAITLMVIGTTLGLALSAVGLVMLLICIYRWVGDTRRDVAALPEEHH